MHAYLLDPDLRDSKIFNVKMKSEIMYNREGKKINSIYLYDKHICMVCWLYFLKRGGKQYKFKFRYSREVKSKTNIFVLCLFPLNASVKGKDLFVCLLDCLFVWYLSSHSRILHLYGDATIIGERLQMLTYARHLWPLRSEGSSACHTYCETGIRL